MKQGRKTMKKIVILIVNALMLVLMITLFCGCGKNEHSAGRIESASVSESSSPTASDGPVVTGTWQTASMGFETDGSMYPEYYVRFTDAEIIYGHMQDGEFVFDHSDKVAHFEKTDTGGVKVQAEAANGVQYTYQTCESDENILEYYETWKEEEFPDMYRGGASLNRSD